MKRSETHYCRWVQSPTLRDDEWVFSGQSFTDPLWMDHNGKLQIGDVPGDQQENIHGVGFFHRDSKDSFISLFLDHSAESLPELKHTGAPTMYYRWHGAVWSRYPLPLKDVPAGAVLRQKNAYISIPFTTTDGPQAIEQMRRCMMNPLVIAPDEEKLTNETTEPVAARNTHQIAWRELVNLATVRSPNKTFGML